MWKRTITLILAVIGICLSSISIEAQEADIDKSISMRWNYIVGTTYYDFAASNTYSYDRDGLMLEVLKKYEVAPYLSLSISPAYLKLESEKKHKERIEIGPFPFYWIRDYKWGVSTIINSCILFIRPNINIDLFDLFNVGFESGIGIGYSMKYSKWEKYDTYDRTTETGEVSLYGFDPFFDIGGKIGYKMDDRSTIGISFHYMPIQFSYATYNGGKYYRFGVFYEGEI